MEKGEELLIAVSGMASASLDKSKEVAAKLKLISEAREFYKGIEQKYPLMTMIPNFSAQ